MTQTDDTPAVAQARARMEALRRTLPCEGDAPLALVETHVSWVLLGREHAYKLKKPLRLPFLDFSPLQARRRFCDEELRINRRFAPSIYIAVRDLRETPDGVSIDAGDGPVVDAVLVMRRFGEAALWSRRAANGVLTEDDVDMIAGRLAALHHDAPLAPAGGEHGCTAVNARVARGLVTAIDGWPDPPACWPALKAWLADQVPQLAPLWEARRSAGRVRECHGDLHLGNIVQLEGVPTPFDALEFDEMLRFIDVIGDVAFLAMDLMAHGRAAFGYRLLDAWFQASGDYDGLPVLRFYLVCRALVRAQVLGMTPMRGPGQGRSGRRLSAAESDESAEAMGKALTGRAGATPGAARYIELAAALAFGGDPRLAITHGLPGSGKSSVAQALVGAMGAVRVRSDVERKRLFDLGALQASRELVPAGIYDAVTTERTYGRVHQVARLALLAGWPMIVDAAFLRQGERNRFAELAGALRLPFSILACRAPDAVLRERLARREAAGRDASEANVEVLERLRAVAEPLDDGERACVIDVDGIDGEAIARVAAAWLGARGAEAAPGN